MSTILGPRLIVAGTSSGVGKTTVATGLMAALKRQGLKVAAAKVGPDFIDPGYHSLATGLAGRNLDSWICGEEAIGPLAGRAAAGSDILIIEGVMGLFDGASLDGPEASTASIARLLEAPVLLVVDGQAIGSSVAALVHGFLTFDPRIKIAGVILNRVGSTHHADILKDALGAVGIAVLGVLHRDDAMTWRDRHLGLVPVVEAPHEIQRSLRRLSNVITESVDLDAVVRIANLASRIVVDEPPEASRAGVGGADRADETVRVALAAGAAFSFVYQDNLEALTQAGAELVPFDPLEDPCLPIGADALYIGGGFPEVFASGLSANKPLLADVRSKVKLGMVTWAECGGLLWLLDSLDGHSLAGVIPSKAEMESRVTLGYRAATLCLDTPLGPAGAQLRGHEFHYSTVEPEGSALELHGGFGTRMGGFGSNSMLASYLHLHLGGDPSPATRFVTAARKDG